MMGDGDAGVFFNPRDFATPARMTGADGVDLALAGIWSAGHAVALGGIASTSPAFTVAETATPRPPVRGDRLEIEGRGAWRVADPQPDGAGLVRLILERE